LGSEPIRRTARPPGHPPPEGRAPRPAPAHPPVGNQATQALLRGGEPLAPSLRAFFELRLGRDLGDVRIHADPPAAERAAALGARAFAFSPHVAFAPQEYAPHTKEGRRLLAHELVHVGQGGGRDERIRRQPRGSAPRSDPNLLEAAPPRATAIDRTEFERVLRSRFGVQRIATGTEDEQRALLTPRSGAPAGGITLPGWRSWDPGSSSPVYVVILAALEETATRLEGVPAVREILFFHTHYVVGASGVVIADPDTGASFGAGHLTIYERSISGRKGLPTGRSTAGGNYPFVVAVLAPESSETAGAPLPLPTLEQSLRRTVTHELGHGVAEAAMASDPQTFVRYRQAVGWTAGAPVRLFDVGQQAVRQALATGAAPPAGFEITPDTWNAPGWIEQPITRYMVEGGPAEDFAEAVMAYVQEPALLAARSPTRLRFVQEHRAQWLPFLEKLPQVGNFPIPRRDRMPA
jgi:hypothetical protein